MEAIEGYLLDNNIISVLLQPADPRYAGIRAKFDAIKHGPVFLPVIAIAGIEFGLDIGANNQEQTKALRNFFSEYPIIFPWMTIRLSRMRFSAVKSGAIMQLSENQSGI